MMAAFEPEEITYGLFGIEPAEFYRTRFALGRGPENGLADPVLRYELSYEKIRRLIYDLRMFLPAGGRVLDVGCGSGPYGRTVLALNPGVVLHGVDVSRECLNQARENGYAECQLFDLNRPLPFQDESFDFVFSMDLLGHIEFRSKDQLVSEIARVTKPGGYGHHGVETGFVDYFSCNPTDESDYVRRYVHVEGHIGTEPAKDVCDRFAKHFEVNHRMTFLYPFLDLKEFVRQFENDFAALVEERDHPQAVSLASVVLGRLNTYFLDLYARVFGSAFAPYDAPEQPISEEQKRAREHLFNLIKQHNEFFGIDFIQVPRELFRPAGFSSITVRRLRTSEAVQSRTTPSKIYDAVAINHQDVGKVSKLYQTGDTVDSLSYKLCKERIRTELVSEELALTKRELAGIKGSVAWRLLSRYGLIKYRYLLPLYRLLGLGSSTRDRFSVGPPSSSRPEDGEVL